MSVFQVNSHSIKIFTKQHKEVTDRFDAQFYWENMNFDNCVKLSSVAKVSGGKRLPKGFDYSKDKTEYRYLRVGDIDWNGNLDYENFEYLSEELFNILEHYEIKKGDLMLAIVGATIGKCSLLNPPYKDRIVLTENCAKIKVRSDNVLPEYLLILLQTKFVQKQIQLNYIQTTLPKLGLDRVLSLKFPEIPDEAKQKEVIGLFHESLNSKKQKEIQVKQLLESIDEYLLNELGITLPEKYNSIENRIFTTALKNVSGNRFDCDYYSIFYSNLENSISKSIYPVEKIATVVSNIASGKTAASSEYSVEKTDYPIIKVGSYSAEFIDLNKTDYTKSANNIEAHKGDIFILSAAHQAEYVGRHIKYLDVEPEKPTAYVGELICVRVNQPVCNSMYLFSLLSLDLFKTLINREKTGQTSHVYGKDIKHIKIPIPPIEKQNEIAENIERLRGQAKQLQKEAVEELEQAKLNVEQIIFGNA